MADFLTLTISKLGNTITGKTPLSSSPDDFGTEIPFITPSDSFNEKYISKAERFLSHAGAKKLNGKLLPVNSVMVTCIGSAMGKVAMTRKPSITNQQINSIVVSEAYSSDYVYYCLKNNYKILRNGAGGSTALPILNKTDFDLLKLKIHKSKDYQDKIAAVFSSLDAKIELNNRINAELEAMAKNLYDYWFVQFDFPDENGRPYKSSGGRMVYNETLKREIPEGWDVEELGKVAKTSLGGTPATKNMEYWGNADIAWLSSAEIAQFPVINSEQRITQKGIENSAAVLLPRGSVVISIVRYIRPSILGMDAATNQSVVAILENKKLKKSFIYPFICGEVNRLMGLRTGAQQPHINKGTIDETLAVIPADDVLIKYYKAAEPIFDAIITRAFEAQQLTQLRDWLLPMLMNGQVTVA